MHWLLALIAVPFSLGFLPGSLLGISFGLPPWLAPSEILLGGWVFWIYQLGSSMLTCDHFLILLKGFYVLHSVVHILDLLRDDKFHPWKTSVEYEIFWGGFYCVWYSLWSCLGGVCFVTSIVFHWWSYVLAVFSMWRPRWTIIWYVMHKYSCTRWG